MSIDSLKSAIRVIPDFPVPGIMFQDITPLLQDPKHLNELLDRLYELYKDKGITKVVGVESRGFILGPALAARLGAGFVMARKPGKLPFDTISETYTKEYGTDTVEIHKDAINPDDVILLHDDLLATGGTMAAVLRLAQKFGPSKIHINFLIELLDLPGRSAFPEDIEVTAVMGV